MFNLKTSMMAKIVRSDMLAKDRPDESNQVNYLSRSLQSARDWINNLTTDDAVDDHLLDVQLIASDRTGLNPTKNMVYHSDGIESPLSENRWLGNRLAPDVKQE